MGLVIVICRPSIDVFSSVPSPRVGFLTGSGLVRVGSSFLRASMVSTHEDELSFTKPFVSYDSVTGHDGPEAIPPPDVPMKSSFAFASYCELPPPHQCSTAQAVVNGIIKSMHSTILSLFLLLLGSLFNF